MRRLYSTFALAFTLGVATVAIATPGSPTQRGGPDRDPFAAGAMQAGPRSETIGRNQFGQHGMTRPEPRKGRGHSVSPVPEPGQWAMMLAGLALVGWIVRRNSKR